MERTILRVPEEFTQFLSRDHQILEFFQVRLSVIKIRPQFPLVSALPKLCRWNSTQSEGEEDESEPYKDEPCLWGESWELLQSELTENLRVVKMKVRRSSSNNDYVFPNNELGSSLSRIGIVPQIMSQKAFIVVSDQIKQRILDYKTQKRAQRPQARNDPHPASGLKESRPKRQKVSSGDEKRMEIRSTPVSSRSQGQIQKRNLSREVPPPPCSSFGTKAIDLSLLPVVLLKRLHPNTIQEYTTKCVE